MKVSEIIKITGGKLLAGERDAGIDLSNVSTDSRAIKRGEFFIALSGPNFRGSDFLRDAFRKGAAGAIIEGAAVCPEKTGRILISVDDSARALQSIAASHRAKFDIPVICVTGSNGKTTVKEMIAAVLSEKYNVLKNEGTKNNHIGVPLTLLKLKKGHEIGVIELGTNHSGEIRALAAIAKPTTAVITNIGPSHLEYFVDLDGVYREKRQILDSLGNGALVVINGDDPLLRKIRSVRFRVLRYGLGRSNDFRASVINVDSHGSRFMVNDDVECHLNLLGEHNVINALAAIAVASQFNMSVRAAARALADIKPPSMRLDPLTVNGISVVNDSYNSNPASMETALEAVSACRARARWVVSGDMLELGRSSARLHRKVGKLIADSDAAGLLTFGELSKHTLSGALAGGMDRDKLWHCSSHDEIAKILKRVALSGDVVLIKGSRAMKMEEVIERLKG